ncbi:class I SAM-dependent DNA methyltransferase [Kitasatospora kifunensis]|uniref:SAM-dependent methyltransferase n=1 Tax=Kitasatospora kifunensis TaxID=58351 RepID=A0A7W7R7K6_KITKI|nr:class I SAM-dependent methyltransferase [Kitasatospora kifunensis]MBB4926897.1 SAM-dependent methyltransferase [Kitasatospora kifunensis]
MTDPQLQLPDPTYLQATRTFYDTVAAEYAERFNAELAGKPLDRAMLAVFAELVLADGLADGSGPVADLGCGPGRITAHLNSLGLNAFGVDLSPAMVELARQTHPGLRFEEGSMTGLDLADGSLAGVVAWYSIIHTPPERLPLVLSEFHRVLVPGGHLLVAFQVGDEPRHLEWPGLPASLDFRRWSPDRIAELLREAGFEVTARLAREPGVTEKVPQAALLARRPSA